MISPESSASSIEAWERELATITDPARKGRLHFEIFCDEANLEELTPGFLNFEVLGKSTREIGEGTLIDYRLKLSGIPLGWQSRIENWEPARRFVDTQVRGPYSCWRHEHEFIPLANGTLMRDVVRYRLPLGWLGSVVAGWKVESQVDQIFSFRSTKIAERFAG